MRSMKSHWLVWCLLDVWLIFFFVVYVYNNNLIEKEQKQCEDSDNKVVEVSKLRAGYLITQDPSRNDYWVCIDRDSYNAVALHDLYSKK